MLQKIWTSPITLSKECEEKLKLQIEKELQNLSNQDYTYENMSIPPNHKRCYVTLYTVWTSQRAKQLQRDGKLFRAIMMDPPWDSTMLDLGYNVLSDKKIKNMPIELVQEEGFLFMWITNGKPQVALDFFKLHGYRWIETAVWVKLDKNINVFKGPGRYLHYGMELCLVGDKGKYESNKELTKFRQRLNVIVSPMREASQKPDEIYDIVERLVPGGPYLEVFGRPHNVRANWTTIGNEV